MEPDSMWLTVGDIVVLTIMITGILFPFAVYFWG